MLASPQGRQPRKRLQHQARLDHAQRGVLLASRRPLGRPTARSWSGCAWRPSPARSGPIRRPSSEFHARTTEHGNTLFQRTCRTREAGSNLLKPNGVRVLGWSDDHPNPSPTETTRSTSPTPDNIYPTLLQHSFTFPPGQPNATSHPPPRNFRSLEGSSELGSRVKSFRTRTFEHLGPAGRRDGAQAGGARRRR